MEQKIQQPLAKMGGTTILYKIKYLQYIFKNLFLRILTGKKHSKIKLQRLPKIRIWTFGSLVYQINTFEEVLKLEQIFQKK